MKVCYESEKYFILKKKTEERYFINFYSFGE